MGKQKSMSAAEKKAVRAQKLATTLKNKAAKRAKHAKRHPNDLQSVAKAKTTERKAPMKKGSAPVAKTKYYMGTNGMPVDAPIFEVVKKA